MFASFNAFHSFDWRSVSEFDAQIVQNIMYGNSLFSLVHVQRVSEFSSVDTFSVHWILTGGAVYVRNGIASMCESIEMCVYAVSLIKTYVR